MKLELILKAKQLGFSSKFFHEKPYKYSNKEDLRYYLWLCELSLWLKSKYNIHLNVMYTTNKIIGTGYIWGVIEMPELDEHSGLYYNRIDALEEALHYTINNII